MVEDQVKKVGEIVGGASKTANDAASSGQYNLY